MTRTAGHDRRGQTRIESVAALLLLALAAAGAWVLWREPIQKTNSAMIERFFPPENPDASLNKPGI